MQQEDLFKKIYFHRTGKKVYQFRYISVPIYKVACEVKRKPGLKAPDPPHPYGTPAPAGTSRSRSALGGNLY
jgi:hypothetical protein